MSKIKFRLETSEPNSIRASIENKVNKALDLYDFMLLDIVIKTSFEKHEEIIVNQKVLMRSYATKKTGNKLLYGYVSNDERNIALKDVDVMEKCLQTIIDDDNIKGLNLFHLSHKRIRTICRQTHNMIMSANVVTYEDR